MRTVLVLATSIATSLALAAAPSPAEACSVPGCGPGAFVVADGATIPQNAPALFWRPGAYDADPAQVVLTTVAAPDTPLAMTATPLGFNGYVLVPTDPLVEGTQYRLEDRNTCLYPAVTSVTFTAGPAAPLPASLGEVMVLGHGQRGELEVATRDGSCSTTIDAVSLSIELVPSTEASPWLPLLMFETIVDGTPWEIWESLPIIPPPGSSWQGRGRDLLFRICQAEHNAAYLGLSPGGHDVSFRASLPGMPPISTPTQLVELMCDPTPDPTKPDDAASGCAASQPASRGMLVLVLGALVVIRRRGRRLLRAPH